MKDGGSGLHVAATWLMVIGAINWGLVGAFNFNLVEAIFGGWGWLMTLIYILVGVSGLAALARMLQNGGNCCK